MGTSETGMPGRTVGRVGWTVRGAGRRGRETRRTLRETGRTVRRAARTVRRAAHAVRRAARAVRKAAPAIRPAARAAAALALLVVAGSVTAPVSGQGVDRASRIVRRAADLMGGEEALRSVRRVRLDMMTQWQRPSFRGVPFTDRPSFEPHLDVRDYSLPAWRNTRHFMGNRTIVNVVRDSIALTDLGEGLQPLSVAYVDEREELFLYTPDRLLLALLDAPELRAPGDTLIGGERHHRVRGTLKQRFPSTVYLHAGTGLPTLLRFRAGHPADFGLVPWGVMDVEVWYSNWNTFGEISIPTQWDITRQGEPYKRMTVRSADFRPDFAAADSFAVSDDQRAAYWASNAPLPMHEARVRVQDASIIAPGIAALQPPFGIPAGAVDTGEGWMLLDAGQTSYNYGQGVAALEEIGAAPVTSVLAANARATNGGVRRAARDGLPIYVSAASEPFIRLMLAEASLSADTVLRIDGPTEIGAGEDRAILAPVDLPDVPGSLMLFRPASGWLFVPDGLRPLDLRLARLRADELGWEVETVVGPRG